MQATFSSPKTLIWLAALGCVAVVLGVFVTLGLAPKNTSVQVGNESSSGTSLVGGPFTLVDHEGQTRTEADFLGTHTLVYFGYTYCPDACPTALGIMTEALKRLDEDQLAKVQPIFISFDPERDTVEALKDYVPLFHPKLIGLTGTPEQTKAAAKAYRVYFAKVESEDQNDYLVDHSSYIYLMSPEGEFIKHFSESGGVAALSDYLAETL